MPTPHISARIEDIASTVLMPGDPLRAKFIADTFLKDVTCVNQVRNMFAYTGTYKGKRVTVMGSGMGMPSIGIYSYELYKFYNVENIIRIGSCGAYDKDLKLFDVLLVTQAYSESSFAKTMGISNRHLLSASKVLNHRIKHSALKLKKNIREGIIHSSDVFYRLNHDAYQDIYKKYHTLAVEMESFALFANAKALNKKAACLLTVSDSLVNQEETTSEQREKAFTNMMEIALNSIE
jgi:purine-nucleoside phosphorylase